MISRLMNWSTCGLLSHLTFIWIMSPCDVPVPFLLSATPVVTSTASSLYCDVPPLPDSGHDAQPQVVPLPPVPSCGVHPPRHMVSLLPEWRGASARRNPMLQ